MEYNPITILSHRSPNPGNQENYTVILHFRRVHRVSRVRTVVTSKPAVVSNWVREIRHCYHYLLRRGRLVVGLAVQWVPGYRSTPATLQLCVGQNCLIFQLEHATRCPPALHRFLSEPTVTFAGVWSYREARMLRDSRHHLRVSYLMDVREVASNVMGVRRDLSIGRLAVAILGMDGSELNEVVGRSQWDDTFLSEEQVEYACINAFLSFLLAKALKVWEVDEVIN